MSKTPGTRTTFPKYTTWQERRAKLAMERLEQWKLEHQAPHELRIREILTRQVDCWR